VIGENTLQIHLRSLPTIDWQTASRSLKCLNGRVIVEMASFEKKKGVLFLPDKVAGNERSDVGVVLAAGNDTGLTVGQCVVTRCADGTHRSDFEAGDYKAVSDVRCYGVFGPTQGECELYDWSDSVLALLNSDLTMTPLRRNLLIKRDPVVKQEGMIQLSDASVYRTNIGTIVAAGELAELTVGTRVIYHPNAMLDVDQIDGDPDLGICSEDAIEGILITDLEELPIAA